MKTTRTKPADVKKKWFIVDANEKTLGRLASEIASTLRGKHKPTFEMHVDCGDNVIVVNCEKVRLTGTKLKSKIYFRHSQYMGGIKHQNAAELLKTYPERLLKIAVKGMLPQTRLARKVIKNLKVYKGAEHPHKAQNPEALPPRTNKGK